MARFKQSFRVNAPLQLVWDLHDDTSTLSELTPPPLSAKMIHVDQPLRKGAQVKFKLGILGAGVIWDARYDEYNPYVPGATVCGFVDRAQSSPFHKWIHRHTFNDNGDGTTQCHDDAEFELFGGSTGRLLNWAAWLPVASMFVFRRIKTYALVARAKKR